jgi:threonylcarbamoyladenosine tRNA methylthiotransferase MtaB
VKVYLRTFGCRANHYDSEAVRAMVEEAGHDIVVTADDADVAVFNSCAVTNEAEVELRKVIRRTARARPAIQSIVMGCAAALDDARPVERRLRALPTVDHVVSGADLTAVAAALGLPRGSVVSHTSHQAATRAVLRVQDGCDEHCTFCATTLARGENRSRSADAVVREAQSLAAHHPEIVITGIHIGSYGHDIGSSLGAIVARLVRDVPTVRFRLSSLEATEVDEVLFELLAREPSRVAPYLHAPLQSGSDAVLRRMGRHWYSAERYADAVERIVASAGPFGLGADVIAGFPGETERDHEATLALVERLPFTYLHVFPFSLRPGTPAERLRDHVPDNVVHRRAAELRVLAMEKARAYRDRRVGGSADVVAIGPAEGSLAREGLTGDYLSVRLADPTIPRGARFVAELVEDQGQLVAMPLRTRSR